MKRIISLTILLTICLSAFSAVAGEIDISDRPMETKVQTAPPLVMFLMDDSGSMDWEMMTEEDDGLFDDDAYFYNPGDNLTNTGAGTVDSTERREWKSQWSGYNRIYYNPHSTYRPWPSTDTYSLADASTTTPRSNPISSSYTISLGNEFYAVSTGTSGEIIVDDPLTSSIANNTDYFEYSNTNSWWESGGGTTDEYGGHAKYTGSTGAWAEWTFTIPEADDYKVYAWWDDFSDRDPDARYTVNHSGGSTDYYKNQSNYSGDWNYLGTHSYTAGEYKIRVTRHDSDGSSTLADAIRLIPADAPSSTTVSIKISHYFTKDTDGNTYLVNLDPATSTRNYYRFEDHDTDNRVDDGELTEVADDEVPVSIKKAIYDSDGQITGYYTAEEDLQNFANWYSYFRRREFTAKAAIGQALKDFKGVKVGFYSINGNLEQSVLPVKLDMLQEAIDNQVIVDNADAGYSDTPSGNWVSRDNSSAYNNRARRTGASGTSTATFSLNITEAGEYNVYVYGACSSDGDRNAKISVNHSSGTNTYYINQDSDRTNLCDSWIPVGSHTFSEGTSHSITIERHSGSTGGSRTWADAVKLEKISASFVNIDRTNDLLDMLYAMNSNGSTPLRAGLDEVGKYYKGESNDIDSGNSPYSAEADGGACQKAFVIAMTDGYYNDSDTYAGNTDDDDTLYSGVSPYTDGHSNTLADIAMKYYYADLRTDLDNEVPVDSCDKARHQHMVTHAVSFGVKGSIDPNDLEPGSNPPKRYTDDPCFLNADAPTITWPSTSSDAGKIDDLFHAAINGRGLYFQADDPEQLVNALNEIVSDISLPASGASVSVNSNELQEGLVVYQTRYIANEWTGDVVAYPVDPYSGEIYKDEDDILWHAKDGLPAHADRNIVTYNGSGGAAFSYNSLTETQKGLLLFGDESGNTTLAQARLNYLRGDNSAINTYNFRYRTSNLGDVVHSAPTVAAGGQTIYFGANDGMLHAVDAETGEERFAFVPNSVFDNLKLLTERNYEHQFYVDLTPTAKKLDSRNAWLVGGLGKGGKGLYALKTYEADSSGNATIDANSYSSDTGISTIASMVKWEYAATANADNDLGYTFSKPAIVRSNDIDHPWLVIIGNGYSSTNETAVLYIFDLQSGALLRKISTLASGSNGLSEPAVVDVNGDFKADYAYAGDLNGNLWKFDLKSNVYTEWDVAYKDVDSNPAPLFTATAQPITSKPDVMHHPNRHGYMVIFGTGKFLGESDRTNVEIQSLYGIWDYGDDADDSEYLGAIANRTASATEATLGRNELKLLRQTVIDARTLDGSLYRTFSNNLPSTEDNPATTTIREDLDFWPTTNDAESGQNPNPSLYAGWFVDLRVQEDTDDDDDDDFYEGERVIKDILISNGRAFIVSFIPNSSPCSGGGYSFLYILNAATGGRLGTAQFDLGSGDDLIDHDDDQDTPGVAPTGKLYTGMLHEPTFVSTGGDKDEVYISSSTGEIIEEEVESERLGEVYWQVLN
ncbi:PilC/PilY family type IV pilus protein [Desulfuromonas thiophila]|uniref:Tfp pilus assembly protein, tip-associated adhesin PilY1 n=1 Tax=Desulfuromonas thiophila TaxID=57664 RepID=A0A1G7E331_9BACT|nr:PilC/PilY family type IV pilus protein [Desulfuromonas thiophila]SDE57886.1 Tfp pilus assembly protein, tip-associated adhesin PilY1 [Desulfuromonas thiophila]